MQTLRGTLHYPLCVEKRVGHGFLDRDSWIQDGETEKSAWTVSGLKVTSLKDQGEMIYGRGI